jgi:serine/arginine repetitive matrix protein 2
MWKALVGGGGRNDSSSRVSRRKTTTGDDDSRISSRRPSKRSSASNVSTSSSRRPARGDDRDLDRGLGDISATRSVTEESTTTYVTAEPQSYPDEPVMIDRAPRYTDRNDDPPRSSRDPADRNSKKKERRDSDRTTRTRSGDNVNPSSVSSPARYAPVSPGNTAAQFAADIGNPGFNQFPTQYNNTPNMPGTSAPIRPPLDSHISQQFPGQLPDTTAQPYIPPNPAGLAADYYGDQGQSVAHQPGVRPQAPDLIVGAEPHLQPASPMANPPPEPSSLGQVGAAAAYYADDSVVSSTTTTAPIVRPPIPGKIPKPSSRPPKPTSGASVSGESSTYGIGSVLMNQASNSYAAATPGNQSRPPAHGIAGPVSLQNGSSSNHGMGLALGGAAAGAAAAYVMNHHGQSTSNEQHTTQNVHHDDTYGIGIPPQSGNINLHSENNVAPYVAPGYANRPPLGPPSYPSGGMQPGSLAYHQRHHGPLSAFVDFWRDPEGVGKFEDYTQAIGVCKYCFEPGTTSRDAPRKHHYHERRRSPVVERYGSSTRVNKLTRYASSEDESRRKKSKGSSWLAAGLTGGLAGYVAKTLFDNKDFEETYSVKSGGRGDYSRRDRRDEGSIVSSGVASSTSRGVTSSKPTGDDQVLMIKDSKTSRYYRHSSRSRSRSRSRDRRGGSGLKEAAIGAAVGSALSVAATRSSGRNRSPDRSGTRRRRRTSDSSGSLYAETRRRRGRSSPKGFASFFSAPSANRRKKSSKKERGFFSFGNSSSSSGDYDLAFGGSDLYGSTVSGRSSKSSKSSKGKNGKNVNAEILGLGLAATQLAKSSSDKGNASRDLARPSGPRRMQIEDDEWEDADSSDSAVSENLAYGHHLGLISQESVASGSSFWPWNSRKQDKARRQFDRQSAAPPANEYVSYPAQYGSNDGSSSSKSSLQQVYPVQTDDLTQFEVARMSASSSPDAQPALVRPGPIPLQQPQPFTPVSKSVYYPDTTAPVLPDMPIREGPVKSLTRDIPRPRRSNSSPVLPLVPIDGGPSPGILKRRSTAKDSATVSWDLTEEQSGRQQEVDRRNRVRRDRKREEFDVLREEADELERRRERKEKRERRRREQAEAEEVAYQAERERRRRDLEEEERMKNLQDVPPQTDDREETESSPWVTPALVGAGAAAVAGVLVEKSFEDKESVSKQSLYEESREKRRKERRKASESESKVTEVTRHDEKQQPIDEDEKRRRIAKIAASRITQDASTSPVYESYQEFFLPDELRHHEDHDASSPDIVGKDLTPEPASRTVEPSVVSDTEKPNSSWPPLVINIIQPTPPASYDGSVRDVHSPAPTSEPSDKETSKDEDESKRSRSTTGSRVSWGEHQTHEYEVESPLQSPLSDAPLSDNEELFNVKDEYEPESHSEDTNKEVPIEEVPLPHEDEDSEHTAAKSMPGSFDEDELGFTANLAAGAELAGFGSAVVTENEAYYRKDTSSETGPKDAYRAPAVESVEDLGDFIPGNSSQAMSLPIVDEDNHEPESSYNSREVTDDFGENVIIEERTPRQLPEADLSDNFEPNSFGIDESLKDTQGEEYFQDESQDVVSSVGKKSKKSKRKSKTRDDIDIDSEDFSRQSVSSEYSDSKRYQDKTSDGDAGSDTSLKRVKSDPAKDDEIEEGYRERRRRRSKRDSTEVLYDARSVAASAPGADEMEEYRTRKSSSRSRRDEGEYDDDDSRSLHDPEEDGVKRRRHRHKHHSGAYDDTASVASSPAKIDETREKRRDRESPLSKDQQKGQNKKGFFSDIFGSKTSVERSSSSSGKREKRSEVGIDDDVGKSERIRKKRSSGGRSSSGDVWEVSSEAAQSTVDLSQLGKKYDDEEGDGDSQSSRRRRKEQKRRDRYEEIVGSARDASEKVDI